jgi:predicted nucleic acid-binding protein
MRLTHLLDTSVLAQPLRNEPAPSVASQWQELGDAVLCTAASCEAELLAALNAANSTMLWDAYSTILRDRIPALPFDAGAAAVYGKLAGRAKRSGHSPSIATLMVAATARANGLVVATLHPADFVGIDGVAVVDWSRV